MPRMLLIVPIGMTGEVAKIRISRELLTTIQNVASQWIGEGNSVDNLVLYR